MRQFFIKTLTGKTITIDYSDSQTVLQLKEAIALKEKINVADQRIIFRGKQLPDRAKLRGFEFHKHACAHLILRLQNDDPFLVQTLENEQEVQFLWTVNYLGETENSFSNKSMSFTTANDPATVTASLKKRQSHEAKGQTAFISLIAINRTAFESNFTPLDADEKYQPAGGGMSTYVQNLGEEQVFLPLVVAIPNSEGGFTIVQNTDPAIRASKRYQAQYQALLQQLYPVTATDDNAELESYTPVADTSVAATSAATTDTAVPPNAFQAATDVINAELDLHIPEGDAPDELETFQRETGRFLDALARITKLPIDDLPADATLGNILLADLNTCRTLVAKSITDAQLIGHVKKLMSEYAARHAAPVTTEAPYDPDALYGAGAAEAAAGAAMSPAEMAAAAHASAIAAAPAPATQTPYLFFDHGGVLDGQMMQSSEAGANDLVLQKFSVDMAGFSQVLPRGKEIVVMLNTLVGLHGYKIGFHSANSRTDQLHLLAQLQAACAEKDIRFPEVHAMCILDETNTAASTAPETDETLSGIQTATWGADKLDGKASLRQALSALLTINPEQRGDHVVFDDGPSIIEQARAEGYQAVRIGDDTALYDAVKAVHDKALVAFESSDTASTDDNAMSPSAAAASPAVLKSKYSALAPEVRQYISSVSQLTRHANGHLSTEAYWDGLSAEAQQQHLDQYRVSSSATASRSAFFPPAPSTTAVRPEREVRFIVPESSYSNTLISKARLTARRVFIAHIAVLQEELETQLKPEKGGDGLRQYSTMVDKQKQEILQIREASFYDELHAIILRCLTSKVDPEGYPGLFDELSKEHITLLLLKPYLEEAKEVGLTSDKGGIHYSGGCGAGAAGS